MFRNRVEAWKMQALTDLSGTLPDYEKQDRSYGRYGGSNESFAPVDEAGEPVYYRMPESFESAASDGERWRWCLAMMVENNPKLAAAELFERADFCNSQFGVGRLAGESRYNSRINEREAYSVKTLADNETATKLATGIRRFALPDEQNPIAMLKHVVEIGELSEKNRAVESLAVIAEERMQYVKAANYYEQLLKDPLNRNAPKEQLENWTFQLNKIVGAWGAFDPVESKVAGIGANLSFSFRNANKVLLLAHEINVPQLLADVKAYLKSNPREVDSRNMTTNVQQIGWQLVNGEMQKYLGARVADWDVELAPAPEHADKRVTITTPMTKAGAYLVKAETLDPVTGRVSSTDNIIVWLNDTAIVMKNLDNKTWIYVADATTGTPVAGANVDVFGYRVESRGNQQRNVIITEKSLTTSNEGQTTYQASDQQYYQCMLTATTRDGRFAHCGIGEIWFQRNSRDDSPYNAAKAFFMSDRPVYRPGDTAHYKFWVGQAKYNQPFRSPFAERELLMIVHSPRGDEVIKKTVELDAYGGVVENIELPKDAELGVWNVVIGRPSSVHNRLFAEQYGSGHFRVEEYKKPEFEVTVDAPREPVMLGETISAKITAKYYFGAPVTNATVKYKVLRERNNARWYPVLPWDWFYGNGYGWLSVDYTWYPGWSRWGCVAPGRIWIPGWGFGHEQPEVVAEREVPIGEDGTVDVVIDTESAKLLFPDDDQKYTITAEVVDQSRRTIDGKGTVLVAKKPFEVYTWVDRGYYNQGQQIKATFQARRIDGKPVPGTATVRLLKIDYGLQAPGFRLQEEASNTNSETRSLKSEAFLNETVIHEETVTLNELGQGHHMFSAAQPGQYRISCIVNDGADHHIEGATIFGIFGRETAGNTFRFNELELVPSKAEFEPGEEVELRISTNRPNSTVMLFPRPVNGVYLAPQVVKLNGKSVIVKLPVEVKDMPNFFVEAITISDGKVFEEVREIVVPPVKRILNVEVRPNSATYKPGQKASVDLVVAGLDGKPVVGQSVVAIYDKSVEYISGGSNVADIKEFFWKWRRNHHTAHQTNLSRTMHPVTKNNEQRMQPLGMNGYMLNALLGQGGYSFSMGFGRGGMGSSRGGGYGGGMGGYGGGGTGGVMPAAAGMPAQRNEVAFEAMVADAAPMGTGANFGELQSLAMETIDADSWTGKDTLVEATVRKNFADTALWVGAIETNSDGIATVELDMPENLTTWKINVWSMAPGTQVGYATTDVITRKDLIIRMQTPRFLVQKDKILLTANVHNYLATEKQVQVSLEIDGGLQTSGFGLQEESSNANPEVRSPKPEVLVIPANGEARVDWLVEATHVGDATVRMKALTNEESDAMQMTFPVQVHGMLKQEAFSGVIRPADFFGRDTKVETDSNRVGHEESNSYAKVNSG
ncbi:MAG: MG2 domain-containing protein, partial [Planctomycetaceae bacterium]|nr:MG2 domain-containing protein [Planctomycetaceae bacterium]